MTDAFGKSKEREPVLLVLADGRVFPGVSFGAAPFGIDVMTERLRSGEAQSMLTHVGEVVFNTAMSGYPEVLTDPSYTGQIVAMTYPHIGNYGIDAAWSENGPEAGRTRTVKPAALVVRAVYDGPLRPGRLALEEYLAEHGVPGVSGVDTRSLTVHLRTRGAQNAVVVAGGADADVTELTTLLGRFPPMEGRGLIGEVGTTESVEANDERWAVPATATTEAAAGEGAAAGARRRTRGPHIALYDCGAKANIIRELRAAGCRLTVLPSSADAAAIRATGADAVMISNGPGDPAVLEHQVTVTRELLGTMPVLGICLGHQIIAEAAGARTGKMKFGHHGVNHPVRDEITRRVFVTSQNHGFTVEEGSLPEGLTVWFRNANDGSIEGLRDDERMIRTTQFHPESAPGPADSRWIFGAFLEGIGGTAGGKRRRGAATTTRPAQAADDERTGTAGAFASTRKNNQGKD